MEWSPILSTKFGCPVAQQNFSLLTIVYDCKTGGFAHDKNKSCSNMTKYRLNTVIQHYHHEANFSKNYYFKQK